MLKDSPMLVRAPDFTDQAIKLFDTFLQTVLPPKKRQSRRPSPADNYPPPVLTPTEKKHIAGLIRVNHSGEVCAQALYLGQSLTASDAMIQYHMHQAAEEEIDHLAWCEAHLRSLQSHPSALNAFWFLMTFSLGVIAGLIGDHWSLGFVAETEQQVSEHLSRHLERLPLQDTQTHALLTQMKADEMHHAEMAIQSGATELPFLVKQAMRLLSKLLTTTSYYL